jgi:two-component system phosphate regulon sensor histidine kinase PhoR
MKNRNIRIIIFLSVIAVVGVIINQYVRVQNTLAIQEKTIEIQKKNVAIEKQQFINQVTLALVDVRDQLLSLNTDVKGMYLEPVQQITKNYFVVSFYDTLNPTVLQNLLVEKFEGYHIVDPFEYGIYDCFTDSIIFDKYVDLSKGQVSAAQFSGGQKKWDHDGHYFGVYFPNKKDYVLVEKDIISEELFWSTILLAIVLIVFSITIFTILRQKRLSEVKTDFINNMTHELKTPISTIALSSDVLRKMKDFTDVSRITRYADIIHSENARLESQVERVLQLAKLENGKIELKKEALDLHEIIHKCLSTFTLIVNQKQGKLDVQLNAYQTKFYGDKVHITNVIYNLLDNATKYCKDVPEIEVVTKSDAKGLYLMVNDHGKGMSEEQLRQIFDKFYRVPTGSVHDVKGFGLGLFYVKEIISSHQGKITVKSEVNKGSQFTVFLPFN